MKSNCLFEAIKAKIKDPQNITIHILSPKLNNGELHVYWFDKKDNHIYHYTYLDEDSCYFFFEGKISSHNIKLFESKLYSRMKTLNWSVLLAMTTLALAATLTSNIQAEDLILSNKSKTLGRL